MILFNKFNKIVIVVILISIVLVLHGCKKTNKEPLTDTSKIKKREIVIVTNSDNPDNPIYVSKQKAFDNYANHEYITNKNHDTLIIDVDDWEMISIGTKTSFLVSYLVKKGDTILLTLVNDKITKKTKNRHLEEWNYDLILNKNKVKQNLDSLFNYMIKIDSTIPFVLNLKHYRDIAYRGIPNKDMQRDIVIPKFINKCLELIHSNRKQNTLHINNKSKEKLINGLIEKEIFNKLLFLNHYYKSNEINKLLISDTFLSDTINNKYNEYYYLSSLLYNDSYRYKNRTGRLTSVNFYNIYDSIPYFIKNIWEEKSRMLCLEYIAQNDNKIDKLSTRFDDFNSRYNNAVFKDYMESKYLIDLKSIYSASHEVNFTDLEGRISHFNDLLDSLKGKVVYVDYWASWCAPCRRAMPASKELQSLYKNKNVEFVYFSIDKDKDDWKLASRSEMLNLDAHNYLVLNHHTSNAKNELKINKIPRYLLYNKYGVLVNHDAPGPDTKEIRVLLDKYLNE